MKAIPRRSRMETLIQERRVREVKQVLFCH